MSSTTQKKRNNNQKPPPQNKTQKNKVSQMCDLGNNKRVNPCCKGGPNCHVKPEFFVPNTRIMTRSASNSMNTEHNNYKTLEKNIFGHNIRKITCVDAATIKQNITDKGIDLVKQDRAELARLIKMRTDWLDKWYIPPTGNVNCYTCDANARNHTKRIDNLKICLRIYNSVIGEYEKKTGVASRTRANMAAAAAAAPPTPNVDAVAHPTPTVAAADDDRKPAADDDRKPTTDDDRKPAEGDDRKPAADDDRKPAVNTTMGSRPKLNLTKRKKDNYEKIDSVTRRQKLVAMLAKKKESQERRRLSSERRRLSSKKKNKASSKK